MAINSPLYSVADNMLKKKQLTPQQTVGGATGDVWTREYLMNKYGSQYGLKDSDIGFNNGMITVNGIDAFKPTSLADGKSYANPAMMDSSMGRIFGDPTRSMDNPTINTPSVGTANDTNNAMQNPYGAMPFMDKINSLVDKILNRKEFSYDFNNDPKFQALKGQYEKQGDTAFNNSIGALSSMTGGRLNSWATSSASQAKNAYNEKLMGLVPGMYQNAYNEYQNDFNNDLTGLNTLTNQSDRQVKSFRDSIAGLGDQYDYAQGILDNENDGDPSNDWQIPILKQQRQGKVDTNQKKAIDTVNRYYGDFQAEINKRQGTEDTSDDFLIPYLQQAREGKLLQMKKDSIAEGDRAFEQGIKNRTIGVSEGNLGVSQGQLGLSRERLEMGDKDSNIVSLAYSDMVSSGLSVEDWLKKPNNDGVLNGAKLNSTQLKMLMELNNDRLKATKQSSNINLDEILGGGY